MKLLLWAAIIFGVIWVLRNKKKAAEARMARSEPSPVRNKELQESGEPMASCAHCGIHFPSSEAVVDTAGIVYCGAEHRRLHATR
jgi:uncharacterized protein